MMVEAGGTEATWELYERARRRSPRRCIADGLEASKQWIGASIDLQLELREGGARRRTARSRRSRTTSTSTTTTTSFDAVADEAARDDAARR